MHSRWNDADARKAVETYARKGVGEDAGAAHLHHAPAGRRPAAGAAWRRQHLGQDRDGRPAGRDARGAVRQGLGLGHGHVIEPPGLPAVKLGAAARAAQAGQAVRRGHGQLPAREPAGLERAQPVGGDAAARLPAAQVHRSHACRRGAEPGRPAGRRGADRRRSTTAAWASCPTSSRASASPSWRPRSTRRKPDVEGLILHKHGIFTFGDDRAGGLRAHDRARVAGRGSGWPRAAATCSRRPRCRRSSRRRPRWRRSSAAPARCKPADARRRAEALRARLPHQPGDPELRRRRRSRRLSASAAW